MRRTSLNASVIIVTCPGVCRISTGYEATDNIRGIPYGVQTTAALGGGSPRFVASASAARCASYLALNSGLSSNGVAGGGAIFGSTPRPPVSGAHAPARFGVADCARGASCQASAATTMTVAAELRMRIGLG